MNQPKRIVILLLGGLVLSCGRVHVSGESPIGALHLVPRPESAPAQPRLPAHLVLEEQALREPSGNQALDAEEEGVLYVKIRNKGLGPAKVAVRVTPLGSVEHLDFARYTAVGELPKQQSRTVEIPLRAGAEVAAGAHELRVEVADEFTRTALPFTVRLETRSLDPPVFRVVVRDFDDGQFFAGNRPDGLVAAGELVKVTANVQNIGGAAEGVLAVVEGAGGEISFFRDLESNTDNRYILGGLATGESRDVEFYFFTSPMFADAAVDFTLEVTEAQGRWPVEKELSFDIGQSVQREEVLAAAAVEQQQATAEVDAGIDVGQVPQGARTLRPRGLAVIMGIEQYEHTFPAAYKLRDATTFFQYSRDVLGIPEGRIMLRTDEEATKAEFDYIFEPKGTKNDGWLKKRLRDPAGAAQTDLFVYLAGHGVADLSTGQPYLIPHDGRPEQATAGVALEKLYESLGAFGARSVTVFVEACFSGVSGYEPSGTARRLVLNGRPVVPVVKQSAIGPAMVVFTAASGDQAANNRAELKHGIFTYFVLKGLGGQADGNGDNAVNVAELYGYLAEQVPAEALAAPLGRAQVPGVWPVELGGRGQRVLVEY